MTDRDHVAPTFAAGSGFVLCGAALLLQELGLLDIGWTLVLPLLIVVIGLATVATGLLDAHRTRPSGTSRPDRTT